MFKLLIINPGSTSTKVSLFEDEHVVFERSIFHDSSVLLQYAHVNDQLSFRYDIIMDMLREESIPPESIDAYVGRGGGACSQPSGVTLIDPKLVEDTAAGISGTEHPAKLGVMLAWKFACEYGRKAYTLNPTNVDEFGELARLTGIKGLYRIPQSHVLNQKAVAEFHAAKQGRRYEECNFIVAHIDGGITVAAHDHGRMVDGNLGSDGEGAFTPTRIGSVPVLQLLDYLEHHSLQDARLLCARSGGLVQYFGTSNATTIHALVDQGDRKAMLVWQTMIYQIAKLIGSMATVLCGRVDAILLTGGLVRYADIVEGLRDRCGFIAPVIAYPGEMEQEAMALPVLNVLRGEKSARTYSGQNVWSGFEGLDL